MNQIIPIPKIPISVRLATMDDLPFVDGLQKIHTKMVGWMPEKALVGKIKLGHVLVAESDEDGVDKARSDEGENQESFDPSLRRSVASSLRRFPVGYCIGNDQYFKRDDVGIIYQMNVVPGKQRNLIGASLIKAVFDRAAYGCKLFCCWCAQDIEANRFWESMGFIPLAFRAGSAAKSRVHIFWQRRIRAGDETTPYWFPSQTSSGSLREDRLVLPIPPGTHWRDVMPIVLPGMEGPAAAAPALPPTRPPESRRPFVQKAPVASSPSKHLKEVPPGKCAVVTAGGIRYLDRGDYVPPPKEIKPKRPVQPRAKNDPKLIAAARELRDRWLEKVNAPGGASLLLPSGKYDVSRALTESAQPMTIAPALPALTLPAA